MTYYVKPGESLQTAVDKAEKGDNIILKPGDHRLALPVIFNDKKNLRISGEDGASLTGSVELSVDFKPYRDNIYVSEVAKNLDIQELYVSGEKYIMARYPDYVENVCLNGFSPDALSSDRISRWKNPKGGYIRALHSYEWGGNDYFIEGKNADGTLITRWVGDNNRGSDLHKKFVVVENIFEELDTEKEWFYDSKGGLLYIIPVNGALPSTVEASVCGEMFKLIGCSDITVDNINFEKTKRMLFCSEYKKITRSDWSIAENGAVYMKNCDNITVKDSRFSNIGGNCVFIHDKNENISVKRCDFTHCGASGVCVFGNQSCVRDLSTWDDNKTVISDVTPGPLGDDYPRDICIEDCYFYNLGIYEKQSAPVTVSVSSRVTVKGCTVHHVPRSGINICDGSFGGHMITDNLVFDTVRETGDHGPFNSWGRDRYWSLGGFDTSGHNGREKRKFALLDAVEITVISHNMFVGERGFGIDLDDGSSNYLIEKNYCSGVGIKLREGFLRTVNNNIIVGAPLDLHCTFAENGDVITNNVVITDRPLSIIAQNEGFNTHAENNLFAGADEKILENELFFDYRNFICEAPKGDPLNFTTDKIPFEPLSNEFGRSDKPKPVIRLLNSKKTCKINALGAVLTSVDDSVRSMAGLPDFCGAYVAEISCGYLEKAGVKKGDVIIKINGKPVETPDDILSDESIESIDFVRAQKKMVYRACKRS